MTTAIITDTASSIPPTLVREHHITTVPLQLILDDDTYLDGEISQQVLLERILAGVSASTSAPSPGAFETAITGALQDADAVVVLTIASAMSATHKAAVVAAERLDDPRVRVVDTRTAAGAQGLVVLRAAEAAAASADADEVVAAAERVIEDVRLVATVGGLEFLVRSGRVPVLAGKAGERLGVNPVFEFRHGKARPSRPSFSREASVQRMLHTLRSSRVEGADLHVAVLHSLAADEAEDLMDAVTSTDTPRVAFIGEFSTGMVFHTGPGILGLAWYWD
ncbi:MAG: DegV family protein [Actinobacteria bacterium]|nr:DegV family protein [Actinomycetota bacterium]